MSSEDEFEFEIDEDDDEIEEDRKPKVSRSSKTHPKKKQNVSKTAQTSSTKRSTKPKKETPIKEPSKKATRTPIPDGVKRKLALDLREIKNLNKELNEIKDEKESYEHELELMEDEIDSIRSEKEKIEDEINKHIALATAFEKKLNRNQKDFDNFRKRTQNDVDRQAKLGQKKVILGIIEIIDNLDRAISEGRKFDYKPEVSQILDGVETIRKSMVKLLSDNDVNIIDPTNEAFDPHFHEAIDLRTDRSVPDNTVIEVDSKGYLLGDIVLRPAKVFVSRGGEPRKKKPKSKDENPDGARDEVEDMDEIDDMEEMMEEMDELDS